MRPRYAASCSPEPWGGPGTGRFYGTAGMISVLDAVMDFANGIRIADPWAQAIYAAAIGRGCRHPHAIRILARAWLRVIWRCWQDGTAFDPALHRGRHAAAA